MSNSLEQDSKSRFYFFSGETLNNFLILYPPYPIFDQFWDATIQMLKGKKVLISTSDFPSFYNGFVYISEEMSQKFKLEKIKEKSEIIEKNASSKFDELVVKYAEDLKSKKKTDENFDEKKFTTQEIMRRKNFLNIIAHVLAFRKNENDTVFLITDPLLDRTTKGFFYSQVISNEKITCMPFVLFLKGLYRTDGGWRRDKQKKKK